MTISIRPERPGDEDIIAAVTLAAFTGRPYSDQSEPRIVASLRAAGVLTLSLVAERNGAIIGHIAFSRVTIDGADCGWFGLGPVSVLPSEQGEGVGSALIREGLARLQAMDANGCVLLGYPSYYARFGFESDPGLIWGGAPNPHFQRLVLHGDARQGRVEYHPAFSA